MSRSQEKYPAAWHPASASLLERARRTNAERDHLDRAAGLAAPGDAGIDDLLRTALLALDSGMAIRDWNCVAEATLMVQEAEQKIRSGKDA